MFTPSQIDDFIHMRVSEEETRKLLSELTPEHVDNELFQLFLTTVRQTVLPLPAINTPLLDCCGTGGSGVSHFNTSTASAFVLAAGGVPVLKFGNKALSSASGSFDFLETLGFSTQLPLEKIGEILETTKLVFLYAPQCYPALAPFNALRRSLGTRTIFNFMGPLLNPFNPSFRILGVSNAKMQQVMAEHLANDTHTQKAWVVRAEETIDELIPHGKTSIIEITQNTFHKTQVSHTEGVTPPSGALSSQANVDIFLNILNGNDTQSWAYHAICLNAGAGFYVAGKTTSLDDGKRLAEDLIRSGEVLNQLNLCRRTYGHTR